MSTEPVMGFQIGSRSGPVRDVMRFHLVYGGPLSASGNKSKIDEAAKIRAVISQQMQHLWRTHRALRTLQKEGALDLSGNGMTVVGSKAGKAPLRPREIALQHPDMGFVDLIGPIDVQDKPFMPLVRESTHLNCELDILFLRQQDPGELVSQGGDIDNRIKTLLDALRMPSKEEERRAPTPAGTELKAPPVGTVVNLPMDSIVFCLMESDTLISRLNIDTDRLLFPSSDKPNEVHLVIEVTVNVLQVQSYNQCLL